MPTIPLFQSPSTADASHEMRSPGGYERWHIQTATADGRSILSVDLFKGSFLDKRYVRAWRRYRARPTWFKPPLPQEAIHLAATLFEDSKLIKQWNWPIDGAELKLSRDTLAVETRTFHLFREGQSLCLRMGDESLSVNLQMTSLTLSPIVQLSPDAMHQRVAGTSPTVSGNASVDGRRMEWAGRGFYENSFGVELPGKSVCPLLRGNLLLDQSAYVFYVTNLQPGVTTGQAQLVQIGNAVSEMVPVKSVVADWNSSLNTNSQFPLTIRLEDWLMLAQPRLLRSERGRVIVTFEATSVDGKGTAVCEILDPLRSVGLFF